MRGNEQQQDAVFSYVSLEQRVPTDHPLRAIRKMVDQALGELSAHFDGLYANTGRPSIAPEKLLRALLLQALYGKRSERLLMEELDYSLLFRWFVGLAIDEEVWDATVFSKNRDRLIEGEIAARFFAAVRGQLDGSGLLSDEHFTVDGTMLEAWANRRSFREKADPPEQGSGHGGKRLLRDTHESSTGGTTVSQVERGSGGALLSGARAHGKSARPDRRCLRDGSGNTSRARGGSGFTGSGGEGTTAHAGSRQAISRAAVCGGSATARYRAPCCRVRAGQPTAEQSTKRGTEQRGLSAEPEKAKTGGAKFCLDQTLGGVPTGQAAEPETGGMAVSDRGHSLQPDPHGSIVSIDGLKNGFWSLFPMRKPRKQTPRLRQQRSEKLPLRELQDRSN
jgi:transposase